MFRFLAAGLLVSNTAPALAQQRPAEPEAVAGAAADCWAAVSARSIDLALLNGRGRRVATVANPEGAPASSQLQFYAKQGSSVLLMIARGSGAPVCSVLSKVKAPSDISLAAQAVQRHLTQADPEVATSRSGKSVVFISLPKLAMLDATGSSSTPGVRIAVSYNALEMK